MFQTIELGQFVTFVVFQPRNAISIARTIRTTTPKRPRHQGAPCRTGAAGATTSAVDT